MVTKKKKATQSKKASDPAGFWLVKQEPESYSFEDLVRDGRTDWTGVRNFQARNHLRQMKAGDKVLFYHSGASKSVVGIAEVAKSAYPDPTADDAQWVAVDIKPVKSLKQPVSLAEMRDNPKLKNMLLLRQSRLSVMPVTRDEFETVMKMSGG
ncbi:MAG TPA: EVE domain-containing protein [Pyrinomonadaceae bacterium]|nr:EVE domain-containing protein [Pyrinomonadaceae bacterium]